MTTQIDLSRLTTTIQRIEEENDIPVVVMTVSGLSPFQGSTETIGAKLSSLAFQIASPLWQQQALSNETINQMKESNASFANKTC